MRYWYKCFILIISSFLFFSHAVFATDTRLNHALITCSNISDNLARLTCFDSYIMNNKAVVVKAENDISKSESHLTRTDQDIDNFAKEQLKKTDEERTKEITAITLTISTLSKTAYGKWNISFENGQQWQQKDSTKLNLKIGQRVVLSKGALSAIYLQKENSKKRIKVKRLK